MPSSQPITWHPPFYGTNFTAFQTQCLLIFYKFLRNSHFFLAYSAKNMYKYNIKEYSTEDAATRRLWNILFL